jgi:hypothetical protein
MGAGQLRINRHATVGAGCVVDVWLSGREALHCSIGVLLGGSGRAMMVQMGQKEADGRQSTGAPRWSRSESSMALDGGDWRWRWMRSRFGERRAGLQPQASRTCMAVSKLHVLRASIARLRAANHLRVRAAPGARRTSCFLSRAVAVQSVQRTVGWGGGGDLFGSRGCCTPGTGWRQWRAAPARNGLFKDEGTIRPSPRCSESPVFAT